jgi:nucleoporin NUP159
VQHIVVLDTKSSTATYLAPEHPFASSTHDQNALVLSFPNWDADSPSNEDHKSLTIVGDVSAVDLEVLGNVGNQWYRQSQENQVSLPLDKAMDDTILLALEADLTDVNSTVPIVYTYLSDGSLQGWHLEFSKPYIGLISPGATNSMVLSQQQEPGKDSDMVSEQTSFGGSSFGQPTQTLNAFGQSSFSQQTTSSFGSQQTSSFGQTGFGSKPVPATSTFGQSSFGQTSTFGSSAFASTGAFGQSNQSISPTSSFSDVKPATGFGAFGSGSSNAFGGGGSGAFGSSAAPNAFSGLVGSTSNVFGQGSFGSPASSNASPSLSPTMTREASMSDSTPGFGGLSLGSAAPSDSSTVNSMFGSFGSQATTNQPATSAFGGGGSIVKPASGFGAFGNIKTSGAFDKPATAPTANAFATPPSQTATSSGFGQSGFASSSFGKSGFGQQAQQSAFGKPSLGAGSVGGFGAFANAPASLASAAQKTSTVSGGFGAFASASPSTFGSALEKSVTSADTKPASEAGSVAASSGNAFSAFASNVPSPFGSTLKAADEGKDSSTTTSPFAPKPAAETAPRTSVFGTPTSSFGGNTFSPASAFDAPRKSPFGDSSAFATGSPQHVTSPPSSPEPSSPRKPAGSSPFGLSSTPATSPALSGGAFGNLVATPSAFKPATGFGAFGSLDTPKTSPFFKKPEETPAPISAFAPISSSATTTTSTSATAPAFGAPSVLGGAKSAFAPISPASPTVSKAPAAGAFSAFSGSPSGFSSFVQKKTSFSDLLKTGGDAEKDPVKAPVFSTPPAKDQEKPKERTSVFGTPTTPSAKQEEKTPSVVSAFPPITKAEDKSKARDAADDEKPSASRKPTDEPSYGNISASSASSSFVEVDAEDDAPSDQDAEHSDVDSFLSEDQDDGSYHDEESAEEGLSESGELVEEDRGSQSPEPAAVPLPSSRSTSATPQPEPPVIRVSPSPEADVDEKQALPSPPQAREPSTTPPGTPIKEVKTLPGASPTLASSPAQPFNVGLGRPSTRPTRSSPLANTVLPPDDEEETKPAKPLPTPESPKLTPKVVPLKEEEGAETDGEPVSKRPKTPPLLSTLGGPASASTPTPLFSEPAAKDTAPTTPAPVTFGLGKQPAAAASTGNLFTTTAPSLFGPKPELPRASTAPAAPMTAPTSIFGGVPHSTSPKPPFAMPPFNLTGGGSPSPVFPAVTTVGKPSTPTPGPFGIKPTVPPALAFGLPSSAASGQNQGSPFGGPKTTVAGPSIFGIPAPRQPDAAAPVPEPAPAPAGPTPEAMMEEGMQKECIRLVLILEKEFKEVSYIFSFP